MYVGSDFLLTYFKNKKTHTFRQHDGNAFAACTLICATRELPATNALKTFLKI